MDLSRINFKNRTHPRVKGIKLKVERDLQVVIVSREKLDIGQQQKILLENKDWVQKALNSTPSTPKLADVDAVNVAGITYKIERQPTFDFKVEKHTIKLTTMKLGEKYLKKWIRKKADSFLFELTHKLAKKFNFEHTLKKITVKNHKRRWGSCSTRGNINLNWRLVLAPVPVAEYVIIHELAHFKHMNHSALFWQEVERMQPEFKKHRKWLKNNHHALYLIK